MTVKTHTKKTFFCIHYNPQYLDDAANVVWKNSPKEERKGWKEKRRASEFAQPQTGDTTAVVSSFHVDPVVDQNTVAGRLRSADRAGPRWRV